MADVPATIAQAAIYTDSDYLAALTYCRSDALRGLVIRIDCVAAFMRAIDLHEAADELNIVGMSLLALAARRGAA